MILVSLVGVAPFLTGVEGGRVLSIYSGEIYGPKETRLLLEGESPESETTV